MLRRAENRASYEKPGRTTKSWPRACEAAATATEPWWRHPQHRALAKQQSRAATAETTAAPMHNCVARQARVAPSCDASGGGRGAGAAHRGHDARAQRRWHAHAAQQRAGQATRVLHDCLRSKARRRERRRPHMSAVPHQARTHRTGRLKRAAGSTGGRRTRSRWAMRWGRGREWLRGALVPPSRECRRGRRAGSSEFPEAAGDLAAPARARRHMPHVPDLLPWRCSARQRGPVCVRGARKHANGHAKFRLPRRHCTGMTSGRVAAASSVRKRRSVRKRVAEE